MKRCGPAALIAAAILLFSGCTSPTDEVHYSVSYPSFGSVAEMAKAADLVIEGKVLSSAVKEIDIASPLTGEDAKDPELNPGGPGQNTPSMMVFTVHEVQVERVIRGTADKGSTIEVKELGGTYAQTRHATEEGILLRDNRSYVMFLETYEGVPASLLNPIQSTYERVDGGLKSMPGNPLKAEEVAKLP